MFYRTDEVDKDLLTIKPTSEITRKPGKIVDRKDWKAYFLNAITFILESTRLPLQYYNQLEKKIFLENQSESIVTVLTVTATVLTATVLTVTVPTNQNTKIQSLHLRSPHVDQSKDKVTITATVKKNF